MLLSGEDIKELTLLLFGGKGGVGKTTSATATSLYLADQYKTLLISTDPAHSLSDILDLELGHTITRVKGVKNLYALEIDAHVVETQFKREHEEQIKKILDTSSYLDSSDIDAVFSLPIPGIDEVMGFKTIVDLVEKGEYDKFVVDTAPTGHALRLVTLPGLLDDWIKVMAKLRWKYRYMVEAFSGKSSEDIADDFLLQMKKAVKRMEKLLRDDRRCQFIASTIPESLAIRETDRFLTHLNEFGIKVTQLIVNHVAEDADCLFCRARKQQQQTCLDMIEKKFAALETIYIPQFPGEVKGLTMLNRFKDRLFVKS